MTDLTFNTADKPIDEPGTINRVCNAITHTDYHLDDIVTPANAELLEDLLTYHQYETNELNFIVQGFKFKGLQGLVLI